jgi:hypothetical protein
MIMVASGGIIKLMTVKMAFDGVWRKEICWVS